MGAGASAAAPAPESALATQRWHCRAGPLLGPCHHRSCCCRCCPPKRTGPSCGGLRHRPRVRAPQAPRHRPPPPRPRHHPCSRHSHRSRRCRRCRRRRSRRAHRPRRSPTGQGGRARARAGSPLQAPTSRGTSRRAPPSPALAAAAKEALAPRRGARAWHSEACPGLLSPPRRPAMPGSRSPRPSSEARCRAASSASRWRPNQRHHCRRCPRPRRRRRPGRQRQRQSKPPPPAPPLQEAGGRSRRRQASPLWSSVGRPSCRPTEGSTRKCWIATASRDRRVLARNFRRPGCTKRGAAMDTPSLLGP